MSIRVVESQNAFYWNSLFTQFTKICFLEIWFNHVMVISKFDIVNIQLVKGNFATCKHYHLKFSTRKFIVLNFQLVKRNWQLFKYFFFFWFSAHKVQLATFKIISLNLQLLKSNSQLAKSNLQHVILFPTRKINLQLVKLLCNSWKGTRNS